MSISIDNTSMPMMPCQLNRFYNINSQCYITGVATTDNYIVPYYGANVATTDGCIGPYFQPVIG
jgi:hypothetical protein